MIFNPTPVVIYVRIYQNVVVFGNSLQHGNGPVAMAQQIIPHKTTTMKIVLNMITQVVI